jgi:hypothetical protein
MDLTKPFEWTTTSTGRIYFPTKPNRRTVCLADVATHLANCCRYGGAITEHYSVAQHSVLVLRMAMFRNAKLNLGLLTPEAALAILLHDAPEAYLPDLLRPFKLQLGDFYANAEAGWCEAIHEHFGLEYPNSPWLEELIKDLDTVICLWEMAKWKPPYIGWVDMPHYQSHLHAYRFVACLEGEHAWSPQQARAAFLHEATVLLKETRYNPLNSLEEL